MTWLKDCDRIAIQTAGINKYLLRCLFTSETLGRLWLCPSSLHVQFLSLYPASCPLTLESPQLSWRTQAFKKKKITTHGPIQLLIPKSLQRPEGNLQSSVLLKCYRPGIPPPHTLAVNKRGPYYSHTDLSRLWGIPMGFLMLLVSHPSPPPLTLFTLQQTV